MPAVSADVTSVTVWFPNGYQSTAAAGRRPAGSDSVRGGSWSRAPPPVTQPRPTDTPDKSPPAAPVGELTDENSVLDWAIKVKDDDSIEEIDRPTLMSLIDSEDYLAVYFCK